MADARCDDAMTGQVHARHFWKPGDYLQPVQCPGYPVLPEGEAVSEFDARMDEITKWWSKAAAGDAMVTVPKAIEYGAADLDVMGTAMWALVREKFEAKDDPLLPDSSAIGREMACAFYLLGKVARMYGAYEQGKLPSEDTLFDISVYSMMLRRIRQTGRWV